MIIQLHSIIFVAYVWFADIGISTCCLSYLPYVFHYNVEQLASVLMRIRKLILLCEIYMSAKDCESTKAMHSMLYNFIHILIHRILYQLIILQSCLSNTRSCVNGQESCVMHNVLFTVTAYSLFSTPRISITTGLISIEFTYFMPSIYLTLHTKFEGNLCSTVQFM